MGIPFSASNAQTPAASSHVAGDSVGGLYTFSNIGDPGDYIRVLYASLMISGATIETTAWTLHLYNAQPTAYADDAAWDITSADRTFYYGGVTIAQVVDYGSTLWQENTAVNRIIKLAAGSSTLYGYLVNGTTLTPAAVAHTINLFAESVRG